MLHLVVDVEQGHEAVDEADDAVVDARADCGPDVAPEDNVSHPCLHHVHPFHPLPWHPFVRRLVPHAHPAGAPQVVYVMKLPLLPLALHPSEQSSDHPSDGHSR